MRFSGYLCLRRHAEYVPATPAPTTATSTSTSASAESNGFSSSCIRGYAMEPPVCRRVRPALPLVVSGARRVAEAAVLALERLADRLYRHPAGAGEPQPDVLDAGRPEARRGARRLDVQVHLDRGGLNTSAVGLTRIDWFGSRRRTKTLPGAWRTRSPGAPAAAKRSIMKP